MIKLHYPGTVDDSYQCCTSVSKASAHCTRCVRKLQQNDWKQQPTVCFCYMEIDKQSRHLIFGLGPKWDVRHRPVSIIYQASATRTAVLAENLPFSSLWMNYRVMQDQQSYSGWFSTYWPRFTVNYLTLSHKVRILGYTLHALLL